MTVAERVLYHQAHPLKLATDVRSAILSLWLLAGHRLAVALLVMFLPPILMSIALVLWADVTAIRDSPSEE